MVRYHRNGEVESYQGSEAVTRIRLEGLKSSVLCLTRRRSEVQFLSRPPNRSSNPKPFEAWDFYFLVSDISFGAHLVPNEKTWSNLSVARRFSFSVT